MAETTGNPSSVQRKTVPKGFVFLNPCRPAVAFHVQLRFSGVVFKNLRFRTCHRDVVLPVFVAAEKKL